MLAMTDDQLTVLHDLTHDLCLAATFCGPGESAIIARCLSALYIQFIGCTAEEAALLSSAPRDLAIKSAAATLDDFLATIKDAQDAPPISSRH